MKKPSKHLIAEVPRSVTKVGMTIGIDLGDVWSHYCTLNEDGEVVDRGRFRTTPSGVEKWFTDLPRARIAMEAGTHSIWVSEQLRELGHEVIVANVRELRAISHSDRKSDTVDAEKIARYARARSRDPATDLPSHGCPTGSPDVDSCPQPDRSPADGGCELSTRAGQALRLPASSLVHTVLRQAVHGRAAARSGSGAWSGPRTDRCDDGEDPSTTTAPSSDSPRRSTRRRRRCFRSTASASSRH